MPPEGPLAGRRVFVTGAGGFIGRHVARALTAGGARIFAHVGLPGEPALDLAVDRSGHGEIGDVDALTALSRGADTFVHLAGPPSVAESFACPDRYSRTHAGGAAAVLSAMRANGARRLIHISSAEIYGRQPVGPVREDAPPSPLSPYGEAKLAAEQLIRTAAREGDIEALILRPFSVYGPGLAARSLLASILNQAAVGETVRLARLGPVRDYVFVADVAEAIARACALDASEGLTVCNLGSGVGVSVGDLAKEALAALGRTATIVEDAPTDRPPRADIHCLVADTAGAEQRLNWRAATSLHDGVLATAAWLQGRSA